MLQGWSPDVKTTLGMEGMQGWERWGSPGLQHSTGSALGSLALLGPASLGSSEPLEKRRSPGAGARANCSIEVRKSLTGFCGFFFYPACCSYKQKNKKTFVLFAA